MQEIDENMWKVHAYHIFWYDNLKGNIFSLVKWLVMVDKTRLHIPLPYKNKKKQNKYWKVDFTHLIVEIMKWEKGIA